MEEKYEEKRGRKKKITRRKRRRRRRDSLPKNPGTSFSIMNGLKKSYVVVWIQTFN